MTTTARPGARANAVMDTATLRAARPCGTATGAAPRGLPGPYGTPAAPATCGDTRGGRQSRLPAGHRGIGTGRPRADTHTPRAARPPGTAAGTAPHGLPHPYRHPTAPATCGNARHLRQPRTPTEHRSTRTAQPRETPRRTRTPLTGGRPACSEAGPHAIHDRPGSGGTARTPQETATAPGIEAVRATAARHPSVPVETPRQARTPLAGGRPNPSEADPRTAHGRPARAPQETATAPGFTAVRIAGALLPWVPRPERPAGAAAPLASPLPPHARRT
ncbi:hypothetical protein [Streptomyces yaizuensis]|uniref:Class I SAM-dependent methyltransferase n=1 Tax=Streptomyces yaizuensis TaxID=2989713 RepID=A0ABQ5P7D3_9ACTN|nr:hypothetical protein [Streptomyces sp. YSPA8]GLF98506.1 class I SAM-dependent methyltransferase [Streptomyces sp. YSPA8]